MGVVTPLEVSYFSSTPPVTACGTNVFATYVQEEPAGRLCGLRRAHFTLGAADYGNRAEQPHSGATRRSLGPPQHTVPTSGGPAREPGQLAGF